jgi:hypothetical protein
LKDTITDLQSRLKALEDEVHLLQSNNNRDQSQLCSSTLSPSFSLPVVGVRSPTTSGLHRRESHGSSVSHSLGRPSVFRRTATEASTARPSLLAFQCPPYMASESWDDAAEFYTGEIKAGEYFFLQFDRCLGSLPDISSRTVRQLQQSFVIDFLGWMPVFEPATAISAVKQSCASNFSARDTNDCLSMFILSIGSLARDRTELCQEHLPGIQYFTHGCQMLERLTFLVDSINALRCRILQAAYFKLCIHPIQAWNAVTQAMRDCMHFLSSSAVQFLGSDVLESWNRAFWVCTIILE